MNSCYYYAFDDVNSGAEINLCSIASDEYPLIVNCTGQISTGFPFITDNVGGREDYYLIYMIKGTMEIDLTCGVHKVTQGDVILFPPKYHYRYVYKEDEPISYFWVHFTGSYAEKLLSDCKLLQFPFVSQTSIDNSIAAGFRRMFDIFQAQSQFQKQELGCALEHLLLTVAISVEPNIRGRSLETSIRYIHSAYNTVIRVPDLAKMENLSNSRYIALFERIVGTSPSAYIITLRIRIACDLLQNTDMSIKQIGILVGYDDAHFFSKLFKKQMGISPLYYRETARKV